KWFKGSVTAYSNEIKMSVLGVSEETLRKHGAVSEETAKEMVAGIKKIFGVDYAVATTGVAGPDGGTVEKPAGTVWVGIATPTEIFAQKFNFDNDREQNIMCASQTALQLLRESILAEDNSQQLQ
ncbi:MAG: CinA family protein, partial [Prolixibacteraceae bacterium]|nr:CinA family protein [Prolixibacteraceae bacterium]